MKTITLEEVLRVERDVLTGQVMPVVRRSCLNEHYERGVDYGRKMEYITIALNNVWSGRSKECASVTSYEKIGYHTGSVDFVIGLLSTDCPIYVYRNGDGGELEKYRLIQS